MNRRRVREQRIDDMARSAPEPVEVDVFHRGDFARLCWVLFWCNLGLALFKVAVGAFGYSRLLLIDGLNSAANAVVITTLILSVEMSGADNINKKYPYGKGKVQYLLTLAVGVLLAVGAATVLALCLKSFYAAVSFEPTAIALSAAAISVVANGMALRFIKQYAHTNHVREIRRIRNLHTLNIAASLVVVQAILLAGIFGWFVSERMGGLSISLLVLLLSIRIIKTSLDGIMDRSNGREMNAEITALLREVPGVGEVRWVRTRNAGQNLWLDINIGLDGSYAMGKVDQIATRVREHVAAEMKRIAYISVHCAPI